MCNKSRTAHRSFIVSMVESYNFSMKRSADFLNYLRLDAF